MEAYLSEDGRDGMKKIEYFDENFKTGKSPEKAGIKYYNVLEKPFCIYGISMENGKFRRLPEKVAVRISEGVAALHANTAGGRVRFCTNSAYIAISAKMDFITRTPIFSLLGSAGFDLYSREGNREKYEGSFVPPMDMTEGYESFIELEGSKSREFTIHFPLYSAVRELYIGLDERARLSEARPYRYQTPIVYYGSSITQGGCASRPGLTYQSILSRRFNCDYLNLGFSGSARGEERMADYIKTLNMSLFVYDYDHNAPSPADLQNTHKRMFQTVRRARPQTPVIILSRPRYTLRSDEKERLAIIERTFQDAKAAGDKNVFLLTGRELMNACKEEGTVDGVHPNDLGFRSMARALGNVIKKNRLLDEVSH